MGTRHLVAVVAGNEFKVANYGQWDGYPSGQGAEVLNFLLSQKGPDFKQKVEQVSWINDAQFKKYWVDCGADPDSDMVGMDVSDRFKERFPHLHRDCGAKILGYIQDSTEPLKVSNSINFAADSLFCEWAYVIDLDKNTFEVYKGFNKESLPEGERFAFLNAKCDDGYYPVKLVKSYSLDELPSVPDFVKELEGREEEDE
jgi:hypothetical protein